MGRHYKVSQYYYPKKHLILQNSTNIMWSSYLNQVVVEEEQGTCLILFRSLNDIGEQEKSNKKEKNIIQELCKEWWEDDIEKWWQDETCKELGHYMMMTTMMIPEKRIWDLVIFVDRRKRVSQQKQRECWWERFLRRKHPCLTHPDHQYISSHSRYY